MLHNAWRHTHIFTDSRGEALDFSTDRGSDPGTAVEFIHSFLNCDEITCSRDKLHLPLVNECEIYPLWMGKTVGGQEWSNPGMIAIEPPSRVRSPNLPAFRLNPLPL